MTTNELFDTGIINAIKDVLLMRKETLAVGESVTSGLLQSAFSQAEDAMKFFQGVLTPYTLGRKSRHLNIEPIHALSCNCVSDKVASGMALNSCLLFNSDWGLGITGFASPVPESGNEVFAWYAIAYRNELVLRKKLEAAKGEPLEVQLFYVRHL